MKTLIGFFLLTAVAVVSVQAAFTKQPYLQNLTDTSIVVRWEISSTQSGKVQYGLTTSYGSEVIDQNSNTSHELTISGLLFDTLYHYRAISGGDTSIDASFHTRIAQSKPFRFIAYGDDRSDSSAHQSVVNQMLNVSPSPGLMLNVGDLTYSGSTSNYLTFFNIEHKMVKDVPLYPVLGNHDPGNMTNWFLNFALPNNERWYSTRYGNSAFICLDDNSSYTPGSAQYNWFLSELLADSTDPSVSHIFVVIHEPPYTTNTGHSSNLTIRQYLCPLFERFHVRIAFQGHNHSYEHSLVNDVHYIITAGGGAPLYNTWGPTQSWTIYREATYEFVLVDVRGDTIYCRGIKPGGMVFDSFAIVSPHSGISETNTIKSVPVHGLDATPNPFSKVVRLSFSLSKSAYVNLSIYNPSGKKIAHLLHRQLPAGEQVVLWNRGSLVDGPYFAVLKIGKTIQVTRLTALQYKAQPSSK
jgi:Icc-related predicted phosphoesterase